MRAYPVELTYLQVGMNPIVTLEKQVLNMIEETWYKVVELYCEMTIGYSPAVEHTLRGRDPSARGPQLVAVHVEPLLPHAVREVGADGARRRVPDLAEGALSLSAHIH
jgi:hypothetical protein